MNVDPAMIATARIDPIRPMTIPKGEDFEGFDEHPPLLLLQLLRCKSADSGLTSSGVLKFFGLVGSGRFRFGSAEPVQAFRSENPSPHKPLLFEYWNPLFSLFKASYYQNQNQIN